MQNENAEIKQALATWRDDPESVFKGKCYSAEANAGLFAGHKGIDRKVVQQWAEEWPEKFLVAVETASPVAQDVLIQFYLLRRTQEQIAEVMGIVQTNVHYILTRGIKEIKWEREAKETKGEKVRLSRSKWLGAEEIPISEEVLEDCLQPTNGNV